MRSSQRNLCRGADNEKLAENAQWEADNEKLAEELAQREADIEKLTEDLAQREADNEKLAEELVQREADIEKLAVDLSQKEAECHKLVAELDVIESKLSSAMSGLHVFSSGDGNVIEMLEGYMERASLVSGAEKDALERLSLSNKELAMLRSDFLAERDGMSREIELEKAEKARLLLELEVTPKKS
ncbi:putative R27-2 protein [Trypanosoma cruzi]|uniref:Putative R27-2 protein n=1 Tax=Trypanosoma cruzi TaxID=5693 RepID=A0A2V2US31_TRYCR|nr:putative R27-2 protein [Trypanosoma cruzi]